jgi:SecD/SecF fusion protein
MSAGKSLASIFSAGDPARFNTKMTNDQVIAKLREEAVSALDRTENIVSNRINKFGVTEPSIQKQPLTGRLLIELPGVKDKLRVRKLLQATANLEFWETYDNKDTYKYMQDADRVLASVLYNVEDVDSTNDKKPTVDSLKPNPDSLKAAGATLSAADKAKDSLAKVKEKRKKDSTEMAAKASEKKDAKKAEMTPAEREKELKKIPLTRYIKWNSSESKEQKGQRYLNNGCLIGMCALSDTNAVNNLLHHPALSAVWPAEMHFMWGAKVEMNKDNEPTNDLSLYVIRKDNSEGKPDLEGKYVVDAGQDFDQIVNSRAVVKMQMDNVGAEAWARLTRINKGHAIAIVLDNVVYSAPMVESEIPNGNSIIQGSFTIDEATDLANILKAGSLPARAQIVDEAIVGPTLGADNISRGFFSFVCSFILILIYMILFYNRAGLVANIALIANVFFLMGSLA